MIETHRLKNVIFFPNNFKFCAVKKNNTHKYLVLLDALLFNGSNIKRSEKNVNVKSAQ